MTNNIISHESDDDKELFEVMSAIAKLYNHELSRKIKEGIRRSKERKALLEQADTKNPDQQQSSKEKPHD